MTKPNLKKLTQEDLDEVIQHHKEWLEDENQEDRWGDLSYTNLTGLDLSCEDLRAIDLTGADLTCADLTGALLSKAILTGTILDYANLTNVDLTDVDLEKAKVVYANTSKSIFRKQTRSKLTKLGKAADQGVPGRVPMTESTAIKHDEEKPRTDLLPTDALMAVADTFSYGAKKYSDRNWEKGMAWGRLSGALLRHVFLWMGGQDVDKESGKSHLAHAACCSLMLLALVLRNKGTDDRGNK